MSSAPALALAGVAEDAAGTAELVAVVSLFFCVLTSAVGVTGFSSV